MKNKGKHDLKLAILKLVILIISVILLIISFRFKINLGGVLLLLLIIGAALYRLGADSGERKLDPFKRWVGIELDEKKERLSDIEDKLDEIEDEEYDISQDDYIPHSKSALIHKLKEEEKVIEDRIEKLEKAFLDAEEEIPE